ncbi:hypothetical protein ANCCAN_24265 [Ancylostoma caninum]|uniref:Uncharacterized protein n=1 Tax=Ancylostoma caninum TaxID=29170 RepID=A0A368FGI3_ANCCA|nr:hypothetical protein ANCCAN_24265 [Ancylostoma caninum]
MVILCDLHIRGHRKGGVRRAENMTVRVCASFFRAPQSSMMLRAIIIILTALNYVTHAIFGFTCEFFIPFGLLSSLRHRHHHHTHHHFHSQALRRRQTHGRHTSLAALHRGTRGSWRRPRRLLSK